jgi:hypothetical protein
MAISRVHFNKCRQSKRAQFVRTRAKHTPDVPVPLEFRLSAGFRLLPMQVLGSDFEAEFLLPPNVPFTIVDASSTIV